MAGLLGMRFKKETLEEPCVADAANSAHSLSALRQAGVLRGLALAGRHRGCEEGSLQ